MKCVNFPCELTVLVMTSGVYGTKDYTYDAVGNRLTRVYDDGSTITTQTLAYTSGLTEPDLSSYGGGSGGGGGAGPASTTDGTIVMSVDSTEAAPSSSFTLHVENGPGGYYDWLALAPVGSSVYTYLQWTA